MGTAQQVTIKAPNMQVGEFLIEGTSPYVQHRFAQKVLAEIRAKQEAGSTAAKNRKREARNFEEDYEEAKHVSDEGWIGIPAPAFRDAAISACRVAGYAMTRAKLSIFVEPDGLDQDGMPIVKIIGEPKRHDTYGRIQQTITVVVRPMWKKWSAKVRMRWDADQFTLEDVSNLMMRIGCQVGIGEGRPDSKSSAGLGWGLFGLKEKPEEVAA